MDSQIQQAVEIASSATNDENLKQQAFQFIDEIKSSNDGWQHCINLLTSNDSISPNVKFFIFQVLNERMPSLTNEQKVTLKDYLFNYLKKLISASQVEPAFLRNALAKTFSSVFVHATLVCYPTLLKDMLALARSTTPFNELATDCYLRTLIMIHQDIGDQMVLRDQERITRDNLLKDAIRDNDMVEMTTFWKEALQHFTNVAPSSKLSSDIINNTIQCIGSYVSWIEINLILSQDYLSILYQFLGNSHNDELRIATAGTFNEILHKKMAPVKKLELISFLNLGSIFTQMGVKGLNFDVSIAFAKLLNKVGIELVLVLDLSSNADLSNAEFRNMTTSKILELLPLIFDFLENEYDDISLEVFPFIGEFLLK
ncbi:unnamed protein product [Ambrosiozyma monospora]|uniref:Exportin-T n=1 Tax=Ambrosiozyma monospora TaxID=43982 RepID=A0A9W7DJI4_AMBMO|nr:unnamed protein product [Ambrosiozyma monospora]